MVLLYIFFPFKLTLVNSSILHVSLGLDVPKHGEPAYPSSSYGDGWGENGGLDAVNNAAVIYRNQGTYDLKDVKAQTTSEP